MTSPKLRVFVSSKMEELSEERLVVKSALEDLRIDGWVFEKDAGARPQTIQQTYLHEVQNADLFIGLFWKGYGEYTIEEYEYAQKLGKDCLIYEKRTEIDNQRDPRLKDFLDQRAKVETGHTVRWFNTPDELERYVKEDVARWQTETIRRSKVSGAPIAYQNPIPPDDKAREGLSILASKVKHFWINGVLEHSLHEQVLIQLKKTKMAEAVEHPWETVLELPDGVNSSTSTDKEIQDIFEDVGHFLLILGQPGSGKTTTLLELARHLLVQNEKNPSLALPTVFNLSSWVDKQRPLTDWLIDELKSKYQIPKKIGQTWLEEHRLLPLLDGLDEVKSDKQALCVDAINEFIQEYPSGVVVCSRLQEYTNLRVRLKLNGAICLQPLSINQTDEYLKRAGADLSALREALKKDQNLRDIIKTPLMLSIMSLAYQNQPVEVLPSANSETIDSCRSRVFDTYIERMLQRKGKQNQSYTKDELNQWLRWLAQKMQVRSQSIFIIEQLQPAWLPTRRERIFYLFISRLLAGLILGVGVGIAFGVFTFGADAMGWAAVIICLCLFLPLSGLITCSVELIRMFLNKKFKVIAEATEFLNVIIDLCMHLLTWLLLLALVVLIYGLVVRPSNPFLFDERLDYILFFFLVLLGGISQLIIFGARDKRQYWDTDIKTVETLSWSWASGLKSGAWWASIAFISVLSLLLIFFYGQAQRQQEFDKALYERFVQKRAAELFAVEEELRKSDEQLTRTRQTLESERNKFISDIQSYKEMANRPTRTLRKVLGQSLLLSLVASLSVSLAGILFGGFKTGVSEQKTFPNQGIKLSLRNAAFTGVMVGLVTAIIIAGVLGYVSYDSYRFRASLFSDLQAALVLGIVVGLIAAFRRGGFDVIKHYSLRAILSYKGYIPKDFVGVLNHAVILILMQRVGGGYIFIHRLLLEHFAAMGNKVSDGRAIR